jgi:hypothetical protein
MGYALPNEIGMQLGELVKGIVSLATCGAVEGIEKLRKRIASYAPFFDLPAKVSGDSLQGRNYEKGPWISFRHFLRSGDNLGG